MWRTVASVALAATLVAGLGAPAWAANEIGVTSAVLPNARGTPPQQAPRILEVGTDMFANERVQTVENGKVHLLFQDGSALSVGPNSDIVLDKFVYDPETKTGEISMSATKGVFRFVGGRISKTTPVTIRTPTATIGIRGGIGIFSIGELVRASLIFGDELFVQAGDQRRTANRNGFQITVTPDGVVQEPVAVSSDALGDPLNQLEGTAEQTQETQSLVSGNDILGSQIASLSSSLTPTIAGPTDSSQPPPAADSLISNDAPDEVVDVAETQQVSAGESTSSGLDLMPSSGLTGRYRDSLSRFRGTEIDEVFDEPINGGSISGGNFSGISTLTNSVTSWPVSTTPANDGSPGSGSFLNFSTAPSSDSPFGPIFPGTSFVSDGGDFTFVYGELANFSSSDFIFAFAGLPTPSSNIPDSGFSVYSLKRDLHLNGDLPFIPANDGGAFGVNSLDTGRAFINWTPNAAGERAFAELTSLYLNQGSIQMSQTSVVVGKIIDDGTGKLHAIGSLRGSLRPSTFVFDRTYFYSGPVSTVDGVDGTDFFGAMGPNFFVLGNQSANGNDVNDILSSGITQTVGTTSQRIYNANVPATRLAGNGPSDSPTRTPGTVGYKLETAGIAMEFFANSSSNFQRVVPIETDALTSNFAMANGDAGTILANASFLGLDPNSAASIAAASIGFGGNSSNSAYVSDDEYGGIENGSAVVNSQSAGSLAYFRSLDLRFENLLVNVGLTPCGCEFLSAGLWGGQLTQNGHTYDFHQVPFIVGELVSAAHFPTSGSATYSGVAVGQVFNVDSVYTAFGTFNASVSFAPGAVNLNDIDIVVDNAVMNNLMGGGNPNSQRFFPFSGGGNRSGDPLTTVGNARFAGDSQVLQNIYGHYATTNMSGNYRQAGVFGAER